LDYTPVNTWIENTRIVPFKCPLRRVRNRKNCNSEKKSSIYLVNFTKYWWTRTIFIEWSYRTIEKSRKKNRINYWFNWYRSILWLSSKNL